MKVPKSDRLFFIVNGLQPKTPLKVQILRQIHSIPSGLQGGAVSIGNFDGVHLGHRRLLDHLTTWASRVNGPAVVFTFAPHPREILHPGQMSAPLTWLERKAELLGEAGVDAMVAYPTDLRLLEMTYDEFFLEIVVNSLNASAIVEGPNFFFGKDRAGSPRELRELCETHEVALDIVDAKGHENEMVSSSRIRKLLSAGSIAAANQLLASKYQLRGIVEQGAGRGQTIGFPTANLRHVDTLVPGPGVYAGRAFLRNESFMAAIHIGQNPTFQDLNDKLEVHLLDFGASIYGENLKVELLSKIRDIVAFGSSDELVKQIQNDIKNVRESLTECKS